MGLHAMQLPDTRQIALLVLLLVAARLLIPTLDLPSLLPSALELLRGLSHLVWLAVAAFE